MTEQEIQILENMLSRIEECENINRSLINAIKVLSESRDLLEQDLNHYIDNAGYEIMDRRYCDVENQIPYIHSVETTLKEIVNNKKSICRFGDGEFACISGDLRAKFTKKYNKMLAERLTEVLHSDDDNILIALADNYGNLDKYSEQTRREIRYYMTPQVRRFHTELLDMNRKYYNAYITRPYILYQDDVEVSRNRFNELKRIWNNRDVVIIEGCQTGMGVGNDLLDECNSIQRIIAPSEDAFDKYNEILNAALKVNKDALILICLGPVATVLAYDLAKAGFWAIDAGHIDLEYEWLNRGEGRRTAIENKYNNEYPDGENPVAINDEKYNRQIIARIE